MKNKITKIIALAICAVALVLAMAACGMTSDNVGGGNTGGGSTNETNLNASKKPEYSEIQNNYNKKEVKKAESTSELNLSFFTKKFNSEDNEVVKNTLSVGVTATRITDGKKSYILVKLKKGSGTSEAIVALLDYVAKELENPGPVFSLTLKNKPELRETLKESSVIVKYVASFMRGNIDVSAEAGKAVDTTNLKAKYKVTEQGMEANGELWLEISDEFLSKFTNRDVSKLVFADKIYPALAFDMGKGTDTESDRLDKVGVASYRVEFPCKPMCDSMDGAVDLIADMVTDRSSEEIAIIKSAASKIIGWVDREESFAIFEGKANKDKLPTSAKSTTTLSMNINAAELKAIIDDCKENKIIKENDAETVKMIVSVLNSYVCGTKGEPARIGLEAQFTANENYIYEADKCSLNKTDSDLYLGAEAEAKGRVDIETFLTKLTMEQVENFCEKVLEDMNEETAGVIIDAIKERVTNAEGVTMDKLCDIAIDVLGEWTTEDENEREIITAIRNRLLNRYAGKDKN